MEKPRIYLLPGVAALLYLAWLLFAPKAEQAEPGAGAERPRPDSTRGRAPGSAPAPVPEAVATTASTRPPTATSRDRASRDQMLRDIEAALARRRAAAGAPDAKLSDAGQLDRDYIQSRIQDDLVPIAQECYESALEEEPTLGGRLVMRFAITGDESVGGVVEEAEVGDESDIKHPALRECMRESTLALTFPPPRNGGRVEVTYPFVFAPEDAP